MIFVFNEKPITDGLDPTLSTLPPSSFAHGFGQRGLSGVRAPTAPDRRTAECQRPGEAFRRAKPFALRRALSRRQNQGPPASSTAQLPRPAMQRAAGSAGRGLSRDESAVGGVPALPVVLRDGGTGGGARAGQEHVAGL